MRPAELDKLPALIRQARETQDRPTALQPSRQTVARETDAMDQLERVDQSRRSASPAGATRSAYVRITRGCNKLCTYCVVPNTRGAEVHRHPDAIVEECRKLVEAGALEITLLGQTVNHYHYDLARARQIDGLWQPQVGEVISPNKGNGGPSPTFSDTTVSFAQLLARVHDEIPTLRRLRFVTSLPRDFGDDILRVIADRPRICRYLHLPVQSGSDRVLARMNRGYRARDFLSLVKRTRDIIPGVELATDIIVGFPGETDDDFEKTAELLERCRFKNAFIFKYSPRPGTAAYGTLPDDIPDDIKKQRNQRLLAIQDAVSAEIHAGYVGRTVEVMVEGPSRQTRKAGSLPLAPGAVEEPPPASNPHTSTSDRQGIAAEFLPISAPAAMQSPGLEGGTGQVVQLTGRTDTDLIVHFAGDPLLAGEIVTLKIERAEALSLFGTRS